MTRFNDGPNLSPDELTKVVTDLRRGKPVKAVFPIIPRESRYGFLFEDLQANQANLLDPAPETAQELIKLGATMVDQQPLNPAFDSEIPSAYTYLGQFIDHDLTRQSLANPPKTSGPITPLSSDEIRASSNLRSFGLDLDCLYGPAIEPNTAYEIPRKQDDGLATELTAGAPFAPELPREQAAPHAALIGDRRNDENLMVSQLHLAFMLAHNKLVAQGNNFEKARQKLRRHYQWIVINDFLAKVADPVIVKDVWDGKLNLFDPPDDDVFMPLEFAVAAFRFGHAMIRDGYNYNETFDKVHLFQVLLPGFLVTYHHIPGEWIIDWNRFLNTNKARSFDTTLAKGLVRIDDGQGHVSPFGLATMDLIKGFLMSLPTGEAVARHLGMEISPDVLLKNLPDNQKEILSGSVFAGRTPLWFYILAEAQAVGKGRLGPVGSAIVASVLIGLARKSKDSYLRDPNWKPTLGNNGKFDLSDLLRFAEVLPQ
jgi:Animal haem peroxidase